MSNYTLSDFGTVRYVDSATLDEYSSISYGSLSSYDFGDCTAVVVPDYLSGSDYSGGNLCRSNYESFLEKFSDCDGVYETHGGHGTYGIVLTAEALENEEIVDVLCGLEDDPSIDDEALSNKEWELYEENWHDNGADDFRRALVNKFELGYFPYSQQVLDDCDDEDLQKFYEELTPSGEYYVSESGYDTVYILTSDAANRCTRQQLAEFIKAHR